MSQKSLGLIETYGLLAAVEAADVAVKSANVTLVGYEMANGSGMTTVKLEGDVGAVKAAISAAETAVKKIGRVASVRVIPRPAPGLTAMVRNAETKGCTAPEPPEAAPQEPQAPQPVPPEPEPKLPEPEASEPIPSVPEPELPVQGIVPPEAETPPQKIDEPAKATETYKQLPKSNHKKKK